MAVCLSLLDALPVTLLSICIVTLASVQVGKPLSEQCLPLHEGFPASLQLQGEDWWQQPGAPLHPHQNLANLSADRFPFAHVCRAR